MTDTDKWIETTYKELEQKIKEQEDEFLDLFLSTYLADFYIDDTTIKNTVGNYNKVNQLNDKFDEAYKEFIIPFLLWYGAKLLEARELAQEYFTEQGYDVSKNNDTMAKAIGLVGGKIVKDSFLWNLGMMGEVRQRLQEMVLQAVTSSQKYSVLVRNMKPFYNIHL